MVEILKVKVSNIRHGGELAPRGELRDGEAAPIICSREMGAAGVYYDLLDGYHRLGSMIESGEEAITIAVPDAGELALCREFGGDSSAMCEEDWIDYIMDQI